MKFTMTIATQSAVYAPLNARPPNREDVTPTIHARITADRGHSGIKWERRWYAAIEKNTTVTIQKIANSRPASRGATAAGLSSSSARVGRDLSANTTAIRTRRLSGPELKRSGTT